MSLWKDEIDGELACEDGRAQTAFKMSECEQADGSAEVVERENPEGETYYICEAKYKPSRDEQNRAIYKPEACTADSDTGVGGAGDGAPRLELREGAES